MFTEQYLKDTEAFIAGSEGNDEPYLAVAKAIAAALVVSLRVALDAGNREFPFPGEFRFRDESDPSQGIPGRWARAARLVVMDDDMLEEVEEAEAVPTDAKNDEEIEHAEDLHETRMAEAEDEQAWDRRQEEK